MRRGVTRCGLSPTIARYLQKSCHDIFWYFTLFLTNPGGSSSNYSPHTMNAKKNHPDIINNPVSVRRIIQLGRFFSWNKKGKTLSFFQRSGTTGNKGIERKRRLMCNRLVFSWGKELPLVRLRLYHIQRLLTVPPCVTFRCQWPIPLKLKK